MDSTAAMRLTDTEQRAYNAYLNAQFDMIEAQSALRKAQRELKAAKRAYEAAMAVTS